MNRVYVILASLILVATPLAGCLDEATLEELLDDVIGCMDENAKNFDDNATTELVGECIYAASMQVFVDSMTQQMTIEGLLNQSTSAGYSMSMTMPMDGEDMGLEETIIMNVQETVKVNLSSNSAYVSMHMGIPLMLTSVSTMIQVGEVVNVHNQLSGMMVTQMGAGTVDDSYQTRDASPNVMEWVLPMLADSMISDDDMMDDEGEDDMMDDLDMMNATMSFTLDPLTNSQTMHLSSTNETGDTLNLTILIDESQNLMSYSMVMSNATSEVHMSYAVMWGDAISITVDETLPRTAIPVHWDGLSMSGGDDNGDDDEDDMFLCDSGEEIPEDYVNDGYEDCYDGSDEFDDGNEDEMFICDNGEEIPEYLVNDGSDDCSDGSDEFDDGNEEEMFICDNGEEIPEDWVNDGEDDCDDGSDEFDDGNEDDNADNDEQSDLITLTLTVANNQTFEAPISDFEIRLLSCFDDARANCTIIVSASLTNLQGEVGNSDGSANYSYNDVDMDGMISAGDTLEITDMDPNDEFDLYDSWSDSYVSESAVNGPNVPGFGGLLATISMLGAAFLLPRRDD